MGGQQLGFGDYEQSRAKKRTKRERFLSEMEAVVPWKALIDLIEPHYPKTSSKGGRPAYPLARMTRRLRHQDLARHLGHPRLARSGPRTISVGSDSTAKPTAPARIPILCWPENRMFTRLSLVNQVDAPQPDCRRTPKIYRD
jgi:hypothetical protein